MAGTPWTPAETETAVQMRQSGASCVEIGSRLGRSSDSVAGLLKRAGSRAATPATHRHDNRQPDPAQANLAPAVAEMHRAAVEGGFSDEEPASVTWTREEERAARKIRKAAEGSTFKWRAPGKHLLLSFVSDQHIAPGTPVDFRAMREDAELIRATPNCYAVLGGDGVDNHCLDEKTQCLTRNGWKWHWELTETDEAYGVTPDGIGQWQPINAVVRANYDGEMVHVRTESVDLFCTPGHRVLCKVADTSMKARLAPFVYERASEISTRRWLPLAADTGLPDYEDATDDEIRLAAWLLTDGWVTFKRGRPTYSIAQRASNAGEVSGLLDRMGYDYSTYIKTSASIMENGTGLPIQTAEDLHTFRIRAKNAVRLATILPNKIGLPEWVDRLSQRQFDVFLEALVEGDGSFNGGAYILYGRTTFLELVQAACVTHGRKAVLVAVRGRTEKRLLITKSESQQVLWSHRAVAEHYVGTVWCLQVPLLNFAVRRHGRPVITGNCKHKAAILAARSTPEDQFKLFEYYLQILGDKSLLMVSGNHENWSVAFSGTDVLGRIARDQRLCYAPDEAFMEVTVGTQLYKVAVRHQFRMNSSFNQTHAVKQWLRLGEREFDIGCVGHHHEHAVEAFMYRGQVCWGCRPGSYQITSAYSRAYGYNRSIPTTPTFLVRGDRREITGFSTLKAALDVVGAVREMGAA